MIIKNVLLINIGTLFYYYKWMKKKKILQVSTQIVNIKTTELSHYVLTFSSLEDNLYL